MSCGVIAAVHNTLNVSIAEVEAGEVGIDSGSCKRRTRTSFGSLFSHVALTLELELRLLRILDMHASRRTRVVRSSLLSKLMHLISSKIRLATWKNVKATWKNVSLSTT